MSIREFVRKWEGVSVEAVEFAEETGQMVPLAMVSARFEGYEEVQVELPRRSLLEMRRDIIGLGGTFRAVMV